MAKKSGVTPRELQVWYDRIHNAEERRKRIADKYGWERLQRELKGEYRELIGGVTGMKGTPIVPINLVHAFLRTAVPSLYFRDPKIAVNPNGAPSIMTARIQEPVINYCWTKLKMKREIKKVIADALLGTGHGWIKLGMNVVTEPSSRPKGSKSVEAKDPAFTTDQVIKDEKIWAYRVSPWHITFNNDEAVDPPYDCRWICHELHKPLETVKAMFPGNDDLKPEFFSGVIPTESRRLREEDPGAAGAIPMVKLYEVTDMDSGLIFYLANDFHKPLADPKSFPYQFKGYNYSMLKFNPVPDEPYPYGDLFAAEPQIWEITKLLSMAVNHIKRFGRQLFVEKGTLSPSDMAKFEQGVDGAVIECNKGAISEGRVPTPTQYPPVQTDLYNVVDRLQLIFDNIVGQSAFDRGSTTATKSRTLGEVDTIQSATGRRSSEKQDVVEDFVEEVASNLLSLKKQFVDVPEFVAVTGMDVNQLNQVLRPPSPELIGRMADETGFWFTKESIQGNTEVSVVAGSMRPLDHETRNSLLVQILRFGAALGLQPGDPASNEIGLELFHNMDMYGVAQAYEEKIKAAGLQADIQKLTQVRDQLAMQVKQMQAMAQGGGGLPPPEMMGMRNGGPA